MAYTVRSVSELASASVRTLHYYDAIGLLQPAQKTEASYWLYTQKDLERLQHILFFRELGFDLRRIKAILDNPGFDSRQALLDHMQGAIHAYCARLSDKQARREGLGWPSLC